MLASKSREGVQFVLGVGLLAFACSGRTLKYGRVDAGGNAPWCPIGMDAPTPADVQWTPPLRDPIATSNYFAADALQFPEQCSRTANAGVCEGQMKRVQERLSDLGEPVLRQTDEGFSAIRVLYTHGYESRPLNLIRVTRSAAGVVLVAKVLETREPAVQGRLMWARARALTEQDWNALAARVNHASLWTAPTFAGYQQKDTICPPHPLCYTVELVDASKQHVVHECACDSRRAWPVAELLTSFARCD